VTRRSNLTTAVYLLLVFLSGALVGVFAYRLYMVNTVMSDAVRPTRMPPDEYRRLYVEEMTARLKLSPDQVGQLQEIMDGTHRRFREVHERYRPEMTAIEGEQYHSIRSMLDDTQRAEYEAMRAERERRRKESGGKGSPKGMPKPRM
jgi:Spy/CpxP family protein refolding chaperone